MVNPYKPHGRRGTNGPAPSRSPSAAAAGGGAPGGMSMGGQSQPEQPLPPVRADLIVSPQLYHGQSVYVLKDPVGLTYFRLRPAEYYVLRQMDGHKTATEIEQLAAQRFPEAGLTADEIRSFTTQLMGAGLLLAGDAEAGKRIRGIRDTRRQKMRQAKFRNFLFIKIPVFDPDKFLIWLHDRVGWLMTRPMMIFAVLWMLLSAGMALAHLQDVTRLAFPLLSWTNAIIFTLVFLAIKVIHEVGHGLAARHHGLEVHETGMMLMVFLPLFYVDTSDAWTLPDKRDRLWITAGGIFIEMLFASVAVWIWWATEPGWVNQMAFNIMLSASITTLLFNANPLLRYDGYYFLMDWVEVPNLQSKSFRFLGQQFDTKVLRVEPNQPPVLEASRMPIFFIVYALAAAAYRAMVLVGIIMIAWHLLDRVGLQAIGALLGTFSFTMMIILPVYKGIQHIWGIQAQSSTRMAWSAAIGVILAALLTTVWLFPVSETVLHPGIVLADRHQPIYTQVEGTLEEVYVDRGGFVRAGEPIARLSNHSLEDHVANLQLELELMTIQTAMARQEGKAGEAQAGELKKDQIQEQLTHGLKELDKLVVRASVDGRVIAQDRLGKLLGIRIPKGQALGRLVSSAPPRMALIVPQDDAALVKAGDTAKMRFWAAPWDEVEGHVVTVERAVLARLPHPALNTAHGGEVDTNPSDPYKGEPSRPSVLAWIELDRTDQTQGRWWVDGMTGRARVEVGQTRFGPQQWRRFRQALTLDWWI